jgi:hypothetical protein
MNCPTCFGIREVLIDKDCRPVSRLRDGTIMISCPERGGCGTIHCSEGDRAQPARDCRATYRRAGRVLAVATIGRNAENLRAELEFELEQESARPETGAP